ncbi:FAD-dependent oxidoreductase [Asticcacaulis sp. ZE23SCel15]|uniref:FAD-dependent oxidoreductase n=1 Tax=Asticcacaulis sp. ZE23SCel15 TaxID=3059027 RepID=UPI00349E910A
MSSSPKYYDAAIIGAGAAGLMCAIEAAKRGKKVVVLEQADAPARNSYLRRWAL